MLAWCGGKVEEILVHCNVVPDLCESPRGSGVRGGIGAANREGQFHPRGEWQTIEDLGQLLEIFQPADRAQV